MDPTQQRDVRRRRTRRAQAALVTAGVVGALGTAAAVGLTTTTSSASTGAVEQSSATGTGTSGDQAPTARADDGQASTGLLGGGLVSSGGGTAPQAHSGGS